MSEDLVRPVQYLGYGIKIPSDMSLNLDIFVNHFRGYYDFYIIGEDKELMKVIRPHYHIHFVCSEIRKTDTQIKKRREKLKVRDNKIKVYYSKKVLINLNDIYEWVAYAIKETYIDIDKTPSHIFGHIPNIDDIRPYAKCSKEKKIKILEYNDKKQKIKEDKDSRKNAIQEYLGKCEFSNVPDIYRNVIAWCRENDVVLDNFYITRMVNIFIQTTDKYSLEDIVKIRFPNISNYYL